MASLALVASTAGALAQAVDCAALMQQIGQGGAAPNPASVATFDDALRKQQYELDRTQSYAQSIGCYNKPFLFFGSAPPRECTGLQSQMQRMRENIASLQAQGRQAMGGSREELLARYNAFCRTPQSAPGQGQAGLIERLFGGSEMPGGEQPEEGGPRMSTKAMCVRSCDGGFFPLATNSRKGGSEGLADMCRALCPGTEAKVYITTSSGEIDDAVGLDGQPYRAMANAFRYRTKYDSTCTCKPADKSWVQALADAEVLLGRTPGDIIVTQQKSEELSRARPATPAKPAASAKPATAPKPAPQKPKPAASAPAPATATPVAATR
jgi:hypothetical protein